MKPDPMPERVDAEALAYDAEQLAPPGYAREMGDRIRAAARERDEAREWIDRAVASCAAKRCTMRERDLADARAERDEALEVLAEWVGMVERDEKIRTRHLNAARAVLARYRKEAQR